MHLAKIVKKSMKLGFNNCFLTHLLCFWTSLSTLIAKNTSCTVDTKKLKNMTQDTNKEAKQYTYTSIEI